MGHAHGLVGLSWTGPVRRGLALVALLACVATQAADSPPTSALHFRSASAANGAPGSLASTTLSPQVLSPEERQFLKNLPEVRVAIPRPPNRPYEMVSADGEISGVFPDMLNALARTFGLRLKPVLMPSWSASLQAARNREVDIIMTIGVTADRMDYLAFTLGATPVPGALFARKGSKVDLAHARIALERDFVTNDWVSRQYPQARIITVETTGEALRAVAQGKADAYVGGLLEAVDWLSREPVPDVEVSQLVSYGTGFYHFGVRKDWAPLAAILNKGIQSLRGKVEDDLAALAMLPSGESLHRVLPVSPVEAEWLARTPVWRVGAVRGLPLLNNVDERGLYDGIGAEYAEQVARRLGVAVQVRAFDSVAQMIDGLRRGELDLIPFLTRTDKRAESFAFSAPYVEMPYSLVARDDSPLYWSLDSLAGKRLALAQQHPLRDHLATHHPDIIVVDAPPGMGAMDMVLAGDADAAVEVKLFANLRINAPGGHRLRVLAELAELPAQFNMATLKDQTVLIGLVDRALADIAPAERLRMFRRWVAVDLQPAFPWRRYAPVIATAAGGLLMLATGTLWWTRRLQREVKARRHSEELLSDIAATMPGVAFRYLVDADGRLRHHFFSSGAFHFLGRDLDTKGTILAAMGPYMDPEELQQAEAVQTRSLTTGERFKMIARYAHPDGRTRWIHAEAVRTPGRSARWSWTGFLIDVTAEHELQQRLAHQAQTRNLLLASASHELRAPTHTLSLALQALPRAGLSDEQVRALDIAEDSAHTLSDLLNDVLDAARAGHEALQLRPRDFDLHQLLDDLARAWRSAARTKGLQFDLSIAPEVPRTLETDPLRLKQVLINLLSNACKYTEAGTVSLHAERTGDGALRLVVSDTGAGLTPAEQSRLFQPYATLDNAAPVPEGSTGLGLLTSRRLADLLGGQLDLHSSPGRGTRVSLTLPLPPDAPVRSGQVPNGTVVVCDDDDTSRLLLAQMLRRAGYAIGETGHSAEALELWRRGGVQALITDLDLPGMSGLDLMRAVRSEEAAAGQAGRTRVVVCSGSPVPAADRTAERQLYDAYLVKPVTLGTLTDTLQRLGVAAGAEAAAN